MDFNFCSSYVDRKRKEKFTGSVKFSFERGQLVTLNESNSFGVETSAVGSDSISSGLLRRATGASFNGSVIFVFRDGDITEYGYIQTYKSWTLEQLCKEIRGL